MTAKDKIFATLLCLGAVLAFFYAISSVLAPFVISIAISYFLNPLVGHLNRHFDISRTSATSLILGLFFAIIFATVAILLPIIYIQLSALIDSLPHYFDIVSRNIYPKLSLFLSSFSDSQGEKSALINHEKILQGVVPFLDGLLSNAVNSSASALNFLSFIFIIPILVFYLLKDWELILERIGDYIPRKFFPILKSIAIDIDKSLMGFVRGQFNVCIVLGLIYAILLTLSGLNFGFLIGLFTGLFSFVPYLGMLCGVVLAVILALFQWGLDWETVGLIAAIFAFGQIIESNFLTPKLIGSKIGLHPAWLIFGLFSCGALFGFIGILIAVPFTASIGVIAKHLSYEYIKKFV